MGRKSLTAESGLSDKLILKWTSRADLARVKGVGEVYADLLGVFWRRFCARIGASKVANLHQKRQEVNAEKKLVRALPALGNVEGRAAEAKGVKRAVSH